jgi:hypothetical protein
MKNQTRTKNWDKNRNAGQALITLLFFTIIGLTITTAAISMLLVNSINGAKFQQSLQAYQVAESGAENALLRLLRNPNYTGETLTVGNGTATITISGGNPYTITSKGQVGNFIRTIEVVASYNSQSVLTATSEKEIF